MLFFFQAEDGIRDLVRSRGLGDVYKRQLLLAQMERLERQTRTRDANGRYLNAKLAAIPGIRPMARDRGETRHSYHLYLSLIHI